MVSKNKQLGAAGAVMKRLRNTIKKTRFGLEPSRIQTGATALATTIKPPAPPAPPAQVAQVAQVAPPAPPAPPAQVAPAPPQGRVAAFRATATRAKKAVKSWQVVAGLLCIMFVIYAITAMTKRKDFNKKANTWKIWLTIAGWVLALGGFAALYMKFTHPSVWGMIIAGVIISIVGYSAFLGAFGKK